MSQTRPETIAVIGLGYVGLPVALSFAKKLPDHRLRHQAAPHRRAAERSRRHCRGGEPTSCKASAIKFTSNPEDLAEATFFIVAVPTPIDKQQPPRSRGRWSARRETVGKNLRKGDVVVYESTVYPGVTEEVCGPILESGCRACKRGVDFFLGYSPERINPGDKEHTFERIMKVVSGQDAASARARGRRLRLGRDRRRAPRASRSRWPRPPRSSRTPSAISTSR